METEEQRNGTPDVDAHLVRCGQGAACVGVHAEELHDPIALNRSTQDSYTRCHGHTDIARLRVLPVYPCCVA
jgi:hypothetical protein